MENLQGDQSSTLNVNEQNSRIRVGTDVVRKNEIERKVIHVIAAINGSLREAVESVGFEFSEDVVKDCLAGGKEITQAFHERLGKDLSFVSIPTSKKVLEQSAKEGLMKFHDVRKRIEMSANAEIRKYISFKEGVAVFSDEAKELLDKDCGLFITGPEAIKLHRLHEEACEALNAMFQGYQSFVWNHMFSWENGRFVPDQRTNYDVLLLNIKKQKENEKRRH